jgi:hypothetical protein
MADRHKTMIAQTDRATFEVAVNINVLQDFPEWDFPGQEIHV